MDRRPQMRQTNCFIRTLIFDLTIVPSPITVGSLICSRITIFRTLNSVLVTFKPLGNLAPLSFVFVFSDLTNLRCRDISFYFDGFKIIELRFVTLCVYRIAKNIDHVRLRFVYIA